MTDPIEPASTGGHLVVLVQVVSERARPHAGREQHLRRAQPVGTDHDEAGADSAALAGAAVLQLGADGDAVLEQHAAHERLGAELETGDRRLQVAQDDAGAREAQARAVPVRRRRHVRRRREAGAVELAGDRVAQRPEQSAAAVRRGVHAEQALRVAERRIQLLGGEEGDALGLVRSRARGAPVDAHTADAARHAGRGQAHVAVGERRARVDEEQAGQDGLPELQARVDPGGDVGQRGRPLDARVRTLGEQLDGEAVLLRHVLGVVAARTGYGRADLDHQDACVGEGVADRARVRGAGRAGADDQDVDGLHRLGGAHRATSSTAAAATSSTRALLAHGSPPVPSYSTVSGPS